MIKVGGNIKNCEACNAITAKAKPIPRVTKTLVVKVGEKMGLDISGPFPRTGGKWNKAIKEKLYCYGLSDHFSKKILMNFGNNKSQIVIFVRQAYDFMNVRGTQIQMIRMDNSGENKEVAKICKMNSISMSNILLRIHPS